MECPKCGLEIDDKALVCPNCKKVLKLACPVCKSINTTNTCKKCGYVIISKCHNCGKVNQTFTKKCKNCGFDTEKSVIINESNTDDFAAIVIDFPNLPDVKKLLGSAKLYNKFKINLDKIIYDYTKSIGLRRQIIDKRYVIRCNRDYTFNSSCVTAIKASIDILNKITAMNCRLTQKKNSTLRCNILLLKKNVQDEPNNIDSGINISLINQNNKKKQDKILNTFQILSDSDVSDILEGEYKVTNLDSILVNDEMVRISEIDVREFVKVEYPEVEDDEIKIPNFVQNMLIEQDKLDGEALNKLESKDFDSIYDIESINFEEIKCEFIRTENMDVIYHIMNKLQTNPKGIISIKTPEMYKPYTLKVLNAASESAQYNNIITVTCYDEMKYSPYSFFRNLISTIFEYTVSQKLFFQNDFSMFENMDPDGLIRDLIFLQKRETDNKEDTRYVYFDIFLTLMQVIPKTLIYIEDFEKIDSSSYDVLKYLFESFEKLDISFLISYDKEFSLHRDCHFLLMKPYYTEITLKPTSFEKMINENKLYYRNILNDYYFQRIAKYACGSSLFIDFAIQYLVESGVYSADEESIEMINPKTIIIPSNLDKLITRRLKLLQDEPDCIKFLTLIILLGTRVDMGTVASLEYPNTDKLIEELSDLGYLYQYNNCIYFPNYNLLKRNIISSISKIDLQNAAKYLFEKVYNGADMPSSEEAYLYNILEDKEKEQKEWEELSEVDLSLGDFSSFVNCAEKILNIINDSENSEEIQNYRSEIYEKISENLYDYIPEKTRNIAEETLRNIEQSSDTDKIIRLCNKMINGAILSGDYNHALELMHKVLALLPPSSINPADANFNTYFYLMSLLHIQILFNIGSFVDCIDVGYKVLNVVSNENIGLLKPDYFSEEDFKSLIINSIGYVALANVILMSGGVQEFLDIIKNEIDFLPESFDYFVLIQNLMHNIQISDNNPEISENDNFGWILLNIINGFNKRDEGYKVFAEYMYKAKVAAKTNGQYQLELFADLMIAYSYINAKSFEKAEHIIYNIIKETSKKGMTLMLYLAWFLMSELHLRQNKFDVAFGIINNSLIQIEKNNNTSEYILMLFKYNMYKVMMLKKQYDTAEICITHAKYIASKYNLHFDFDTNSNHYIANVNEENDLSVNPLLDSIYPNEESEG